MKKALLFISRYFSALLAPLLVLSSFLIYVMFTVPAIFWVGRSASGNIFTDNYGGMMVNFFKDDYLRFFLFPFLPFLGTFLVLSVFIWIYYRHDKAVGKIGFKNTVLCLLSFFMLVLLPISATQLGYKIEEQRRKEIAQFHSSDGTVYVNKGVDRKFLKLYQTLADEGIEAWRKDPVAVVKNELEKGDLTSLNHGSNSLTLESTERSNSDRITNAVVLLDNERYKAEIRLNRYWESDDGVWLVKSYRIITDYAR
ncbi:MAG: hypothetical protein WCW25_00885 [Patescibacteria group bacterium]|jgi:hypothetical protein